MNRKSKIIEFLNGALFCGIFVLLQVLAFLNIVQFNIKTFLPYFITALVLIIASKLPVFDAKYRAPRTLFVLSVVGAILSLVVGNGSGDMLLKIMYALIGYVGFVFIVEKRINIIIFPIILVVLYYYFYNIFYYDIEHSIRVGDFFEISSSNAIPISLNGVFLFYYLISKYYYTKHPFVLVVFSLINAYLVILQESRIGVVVAVAMVIICFYDLFAYSKEKKNSRVSVASIVLVFAGVVFLYFSFSREISSYLQNIDLTGVESYEQDGRSVAQSHFFKYMTVSNFLFGYNINFAFVGSMHRTFNSFLDFWSRYTIFPFVYLVYCIIIRFLKRRNYSIPLYSILPVFLYAFFESIWSGALWDIMLYLVCFLSDDRISSQDLLLKNTPNENNPN